MFAIFGKVSLIILFTGLIALAIMFDWLGSRDLAHKGISGAGAAVEFLEEKGDKLGRVMKTINEEDR